MIDYSEFFQYLKCSKLNAFAEVIQKTTENITDNINHGDFDKWQKNIKSLPSIKPSFIQLDSDIVTIGAGNDLNISRHEIKEILKSFYPWRKGPFKIFDINIETEWRSDFKWNRLKDEIYDIKDKCILDIGCGNGYHCFRMAAHEPKAVIGIDPFLLYVMQFNLINKFARLNNVSVLPLGIQNLPIDISCFDMVFSMGVLYHRKKPIEHLKHIYNLLGYGGQAIIETLVLNVKHKDVLKPKGRYAKMRNVFEIPSPLLLTQWLHELGYNNIKIIDISPTTQNEQRKTGWMIFESLPDFLDPSDNTKTIEGYPAPVRAIAIAEKTTS